MSTHPARAATFHELRDMMAAARDAKLVSEAVAGNLSLYCYTKSCVYDRQWSPVTVMARGLVLDRATERVVATPFPKFFNIGERVDPVPAQPFETFEKVDGSLIIIFWHDGEWRTATKGSLVSKQAEWARVWMADYDLSPLTRGTTYLAEAVYPENRIVVHYEVAGLVLLAAYDEGGEELKYEELLALSERLRWPLVRRHSYASIADLVARAGTLPATEEGFVVRFKDGTRLKIKGDEYKRIHALISNVTPLTLWNAMQAGDDMELMRRELPEEFWGDFDTIRSLIGKRIEEVVSATKREAESVASLSDKDVGLRLSEFPPDVRGFIFPYRKGGGDLLSGRSRQALFRHIRPAGNNLAGYMPSYGISRVIDEDA